jgi:hypothetical protein
MKTKLFLALSVCAAAPFTQADPVVDWNKAALASIRADRSNPLKASRSLAIAHIAIYDAVNGVQRTHRPYHVQATAPAGADLAAAVAAAGRTALTALYPAQGTNYLPLAEAQLAGIADGPAKTAGAAWGESVAQQLLQLRANDGSTNVAPYTPGTNAGQWRPTPPALAAALLPGWGQVTPFTMTAGSQFRPPPPPPVDSSAYAFEFNTVKLYGGTNSTLRTADQTQVALFWADGAGTETPPGHWHHIAQVVAEAASPALSVHDSARLFALLGLATGDAAICSWDAKYAFDLWRPITAVREADTDGNPETEADPTWTSLVTTPPFPEYTSGHSTFSRASATVLAGFFGGEKAFTIGSDGLPGVTRSFTSFSEAADESGISRLYGGIHWPSANLHGQSCGLQLARQLLANFLRPLEAAQFGLLVRAGQTVTLDLTVEPGRPYVVEASADLETWTALGTVNSATPQAQFTDTAAAGGLRFYRALAR